MNKENKIIIALDAMGGDNAPFSVIEGASFALSKNSKLFFRIFGNKNILQDIINKHAILVNNYELIHTEEVIKSDDKPVDALRNRKNSSMRLAVDDVHAGNSQAVVSSGNTGALMVISKMVLKSISGVDRPAIITYVPTVQNPCVILDLGANAECSSDNLLQFAIMGSAFSSIVLDTKFPRVGLLNIGSEALKGNVLVQEASDLISQYANVINYAGFAEGDDIFTGKFDVIVSDGFTGNIALKVLEGTARFIKYKLSSVFKNSIASKIGLVFLLLFSMLRIRKMREEIDPRNYNGAMLIGLNGISVKSHGSADKKSFATAINVAYKLVVGNINEQIKKELIILQK